MIGCAESSATTGAVLERAALIVAGALRPRTFLLINRGEFGALHDFA